MAEEPLPPSDSIQEGAEPPESLPANAEDRKAAAAMSKLDLRGEEDTQPKKEMDLKALNDAMKNLGVAQEGMEKPATVKKEEVPKAVVKVDAGDVGLVMDQLDLSKAKATELLRAHEADVVKAMTAWVTATG